MANNKYLRSIKRERELVNFYRKMGLVSARTAGSHSPFDIFVWDKKNKEVSFIQVKTSKGANISYTTDYEVHNGVRVKIWTQKWAKDKGG